MSDIDSDEDGLWDWLKHQSEKKSIQPVPTIAPESSRGNTAETPIQRSQKNVMLRKPIITKKYSGSKSKLSTSETKPQHSPNTREPTEEERKKIILSEMLKDIKLKVERAKSNREQLKQIYEDRIKSDPHKKKRHLSFDDLREEYVK